MTNWEFITAIVGFAILPVVLVVKSWRKTRKTSWEWVCFALWPMSTYIAFGQFWILPTLAEFIRSFSLPDGITSFFISGTQVMTIFVGPFLYFMLWDAVEEPTITEPKQWRLFRSFTAVIALVLFFLPGVTEIAGIQPPALMQNVVIVCYIVTLIAFVFAQVKIVGNRVIDAARIVADTSQHISNENKEVRKGSLQRLGKVAEHSPAAQDLIIGFLEDEDDEILLLALTYVKRFSVRAAAAVPNLATLMAKDKPPNSREGIHDLLVEITGTDQGSDAEKWVSWAEENYAQLAPRRQDNFAIKYSKLDEKMIEQISMMYNSKNTPELQEFVATANKNEYSPETFEAIRRLIELRRENSLKRISENLKDEEEVEKIFQKEKEKEFQDHLKDTLEEIDHEKNLLKKSIKSVHLKRKIVSVIGIVFLFLASIIAISAKDFGTFVFYLFVCLLFFGVPVYYFTNKYKKHNVKLLELEKENANLARKVRST